MSALFESLAARAAGLRPAGTVVVTPRPVARFETTFGSTFVAETVPDTTNPAGDPSPSAERAPPVNRGEPPSGEPLLSERSGWPRATPAPRTDRGLPALAAAPVQPPGPQGSAAVSLDRTADDFRPEELEAGRTDHAPSPAISPLPVADASERAIRLSPGIPPSAASGHPDEQVDRLSVGRMLAHLEPAAPDAGARARPAAAIVEVPAVPPAPRPISVSIGRIDVAIAAPISPSRPVVERTRGFAGYESVRRGRP